ncbi:MAG: beta-lactamase family protein [Deltaproteobacteria bacterium]|nr:beta-lactamase family protein [Deltaproteobacteria bacterium]
MTKKTIFDLASLTKPLATTLAVMHLVQHNKLNLEQSIESVLPEFKNSKKGEIQIKHLLYHNSGLVDYRPYYKTIGNLPVNKRKTALRELLASEHLSYSTGEKIIYSDPGFMILEWIIENITKMRFDHFVKEKVYAPFSFVSDHGLFFVGSDSKYDRELFAATEFCPWRNALVEGSVHDENAYTTGGTGGHAGLFGTAYDVYELLSLLLSSFHGLTGKGIFQKELIRGFLAWQKTGARILGFDVPSLRDSASGKYFSKRSAGHLGFTGTSFWVDFDRRVIVILLTNRVHPSRNNIKIRFFRPVLHDAVMESILRD